MRSPTPLPTSLLSRTIPTVDTLLSVIHPCSSTWMPRSAPVPGLHCHQRVQQIVICLHCGKEVGLSGTLEVTADTAGLDF